MYSYLSLFVIVFFIEGIRCEPYNQTKFKGARNMKDYGPFYITTQSLSICKPSIPVSKEYTAVAYIKSVKTSRTTEDFQGNVTVEKDVTLTGGLVKVDTWQDGGFKPMLHRKVSNACVSVALMAALQSFVKPDSNCMIKKGIYQIKNINPNTVAHKMTSNLIYNKYSFTLEFYTKTGALFCLKMLCEVKPMRTKKD